MHIPYVIRNNLENLYKFNMFRYLIDSLEVMFQNLNSMFCFHYTQRAWI